MKERYEGELCKDGKKWVSWNDEKDSHYCVSKGIMGLQSGSETLLMSQEAAQGHKEKKTKKPSPSLNEIQGVSIRVDTETDSVPTLPASAKLHIATAHRHYSLAS